MNYEIISVKLFKKKDGTLAEFTIYFKSKNYKFVEYVTADSKYEQLEFKSNATLISLLVNKEILTLIATTDTTEVEFITALLIKLNADYTVTEFCLYYQ